MVKVGEDFVFNGYVSLFSCAMVARAIRTRKPS